MARCVSGWIAFWRMGWACWIMFHPEANTVAILFATSEMLTAAIGMLNSLLARIDDRWQGYTVPFLYCLGFVVVPAPVASAPWMDAMLLVILAFRMWAFWILGLGYSVGPPAWVSLAERGPYRWVRHPMQLSGLLLRLVFCVANPVLVNWSGLLIMSVAAVGVVIGEESFLGSVREWRSYRERVRWRLVPFVW